MPPDGVFVSEHAAQQWVRRGGWTGDSLVYASVRNAWARGEAVSHDFTDVDAVRYDPRDEMVLLERDGVIVTVVGAATATRVELPDETPTPVADGGVNRTNRRECHRCGDELDGRVKVKRFGEYDAAIQNFDHTGGVIEHWYCNECWQDHEAREPAAAFHPESASQLRAILEASDGRLVADFVHYFIGSRPCVRVVNGGLEGATIRADFDERETADGVTVTVSWHAEPVDVEDGWLAETLGQRDHLPDEMPVLLRPVDESPFAELEEVSA